MKKVEAEKGIDRRERLHMTPHILRRIKVMCEPSASDPDVVMLWAARCLGFFGFLRTGEMTVPSYSAYDPSVHLSYKDIAVDDLANPQTVSVFIKQSKTDLFRRGINLFVGRTSSDLCPVMALLNYLVVRGPREGSLFMFSDGRRCRALGHPSKYCGHSFRIGAATAAAERGMEDSVIKTLGRWRSLAYLEYIRNPREQLAQMLEGKDVFGEGGGGEGGPSIIPTPLHTPGHHAQDMKGGISGPTPPPNTYTAPSCG